MIIPQRKHIEFYEQQIKAHEDYWRQYADTAMSILIKDKKLFIGRIWGIQEKQGNVVLRFNEGEVPRMKQPYFLGLVGSEAPKNPLSWRFSYEDFRVSEKPRFWNGVSAEIFTLTYWKTEDKKSFILVSGFDLDVLTIIKEKYLEQKIHPLVVVAEKDPPVDYLVKLKEFLVKSKKNKILNLNLTVTEQSWQPQDLDNSSNLSKKIIDLIDSQHETILQGPPGTGKSFMAAEICNHYLKKGFSVCVTALTNKALIEIASKQGLKEPINEGRVFKSNLSSDESKQLPGLNRVDSFILKQGDLLLSTYYKLAQKQAKLIDYSYRFDLVIIEEASQAYLATLAMFRSIASKILVIGDHKQLTPVVLNLEESRNIFPLIDAVINGLKTYAFNNESKSYRLTKTRRLTFAASQLTGLYYNKKLESISDLESKTGFSSEFNKLFHPEGGISIAKLSTARTGFAENQLIAFIAKVGFEILKNNPEFEVAILCPYVDSESRIYHHYNKITNDFSRITINTVHKIQGLTTDLTIVYLPIDNAAFELNENLFNVATSRAKRGTLVVTYRHISLTSSASKETIQFINNCQDITEVFNDLLMKRIYSQQKK